MRSIDGMRFFCPLPGFNSPLGGGVSSANIEGELIVNPIAITHKIRKFLLIAISQIYDLNSATAKFRVKKR